MKIAFTIPAIPIAQPRQRVGVIAGRARTYTPIKAPVNAYKATCRIAAAQSGQAVVLDGPIALKAVFVLPRPSAKIWKARPMPRERHAKKPDADNLAKSLLDALTGLLWRDDSQISSLTIEKWIAAGDERPHVEVEVMAVTT